MIDDDQPSKPETGPSSTRQFWTVLGVATGFLAFVLLLDAALTCGHHDEEGWPRSDGWGQRGDGGSGWVDPPDPRWDESRGPVPPRAGSQVAVEWTSWGAVDRSTVRLHYPARVDLAYSCVEAVPFVDYGASMIWIDLRFEVGDGDCIPLGSQESRVDVVIDQPIDGRTVSR